MDHCPLASVSPEFSMRTTAQQGSIPSQTDNKHLFVLQSLIPNFFNPCVKLTTSINYLLQKTLDSYFVNCYNIDQKMPSNVRTSYINSFSMTSISNDKGNNWTNTLMTTYNIYHDRFIIWLCQSYGWGGGGWGGLPWEPCND